MRDHRKLRAFELADGLVLSIYAATKTFPKEEQFGLTSQLRRSAVSIASNIVEAALGARRLTTLDFWIWRLVRHVKSNISFRLPRALVIYHETSVANCRSRPTKRRKLSPAYCGRFARTCRPSSLRSQASRLTSQYASLTNFDQLSIRTLCRAYIGFHSGRTGA